MSEDAIGGLSRRRFVTSAGAAAVVSFAGCTENTNAGEDESDGGDSGGDLSGEIVVKGSSTVFPVSDAIAERFMEEHPGVNVTVDSTGSGGGFENWFCAGDSDLNGASRPIKDSEVDQCAGNDVEPLEFQVAGDALTVAVNNEAEEWVECVTFEELSQIWREDGAQRWSDVRDEWPDEEFQLYGPAETSGTYDWFAENVVGEEYEHTVAHQPTEEDEQIVQGIRDNTAAMGYFGYAYYSANSDQVRALEIEAEPGDGCTAPSLENAKDGSYPMARPLFVYVAQSALERDEVYEFMRFYIEHAETDLVQEIGYVPSSADQRDENLETLNEAAGR